MPATLPTVVDLHVMSAEIFEVVCYPFCISLYLILIDLLIVEVPGAPTRRRQRKSTLVDRCEKFDTESFLVIVSVTRTVARAKLVFGRIECAVSECCFHIAKDHDEEVFVAGVSSAGGNCM